MDIKVIGHLYLEQTEQKKFNTWKIRFIFNKKYHKKGYATESLKSLIEYSFQQLNVHKIIAHCNPKNIASWKLLERVKCEEKENYIKIFITKKRTIIQYG